MSEERRRVTLTKGQCDTAAGSDLVVLLTELSSDGNVSREEMNRLRACWKLNAESTFRRVLSSTKSSIRSRRTARFQKMNSIVLRWRLSVSSQRKYAPQLPSSGNRHEKRGVMRNARRDARQQSPHGTRGEPHASLRERRPAFCTRPISPSAAHFVRPNAARHVSG